jgi:hypothetical protein
VQHDNRPTSGTPRAADDRLWVWTGLAELAVEVLTLDRLALTRSTGHVAGPTQSHTTRLTRSAG